MRNHLIGSMIALATVLAFSSPARAQDGAGFANNMYNN